MSRTRMIAIVMGAALVASSSALKASVDFLAVDDKATLTSDTNVVVTGALVCTSGETASISVVITQDHGQGSLAGQGTVDVPCTGTAQTFAVPVDLLTPPNGAFKKGPASVILNASTATDNLTQVDRIQISR